MSPSSLTVFVGVTPGLESLLAEELRELGFDAHGGTTAGVEFVTTHQGLWDLALRSRLAESLRVRLKRFPAYNFNELEKRLATLPWAAYFPRESAPAVLSTTRRSALFHTDAINERAALAIATRLARGDAPSKDAVVPPSTVHIRFVRDKAQVSIDAAGELLHKRGYRTHVGAAPLRETLAAACLRAAGVQRGDRLWDPFCGSGTLPIEAASHALGLPAPVNRTFAFESWPIHDADSWTEAQTRLRDAAQTAIAGADASLWIGSDINPKEVEAATHNAQTAGLAQLCRFETGDVVDVAKKIPEGTAIVTNLPYGQRTGGSKGIATTFARFGDLLRQRQDLRPVTVLNGHQSFRTATGLKWEEVLSFSNRGVPVELLRLKDK